MAEFFNNIKQKIIDFYKSLDKKKKIIILASVLFVILVVFIILFLSRPKYVVLASDLEYAQMSKIVEKLDEMNIKHKDNGSNNIFVDVNDITKAKMAMAVDLNINQPDYSWTDVFANTSFSMTQEMRQQQLRLASASALKDGLVNYLEGVKDAHVELFIGKESNFLLEQNEDSSVSVMLVLEEGFEFNKAQIDGIVNYVKNSIENLPKENITIIDQTGKPLNNFSDEADAFIASTYFEQKNIVEKRLVDKITNFLSAVYGRNHVRVVTNVELDFDDYSTTSKVYAPPIEGKTDGIIRSMSELKEKVVSGDSSEGIPGTDTNTDVTDYPTAMNEKNSVEKVSKTVNYEMNEIVTVLQKAKGKIKDITVAIFIDTTNLENEELTEDHKKDIIKLVTTAAGLETRSVEVSGMKFSENEMGIVVYDSETDQIDPGIPMVIVVIIIAALAVGVAIFIIIGKLKAKKKREEEIKRMQEEQEAKRAAELEEIKMNEEDKSSPKYQIAKFIESKPEAVAQLLKSWMLE